MARAVDKGGFVAEIGAFLSSEEHGPRALVDQAKLAEEAGMHSIFISDHYHPWIDRQGESPFVWEVIGAISASTSHKGDNWRHLPDGQDSSGDIGSGRGHRPDPVTGQFRVRGRFG
jgi:hypothetical protein